MSKRIKVTVIKYPDRKNLAMRYVDPVTGKQVCRSTGITKKREAERAAAKWEAELHDGRYQKASLLTWENFRERYELEHLRTLADSTLRAASTAFNHLERIIDPKLLESLTSEQLSRFQLKLTAEGMKATTLAAHLRSIRAAVNWAARKKLMRVAPDIDMPKKAKGVDRSMRGRAITVEEFERMLEAVPKVRKREPEKWATLLHGLWLSGLRISEALSLSWDADAEISVDMDGKYPRLRLLSAGHKGRRDQYLTIAPEFGEMLSQIPPAERRGLVFGIEGRTPGKPLDAKLVGRYISAIGERALVVVDATESKFATAHDLRRAFGTRWATKVMPVVLMKLMRHRTIDTTMKYYVDIEEDALAEELRAASGNISGNIMGTPETESKKTPRKPVHPRGFEPLTS